MNTLGVDRSIANHVLAGDIDLPFRPGRGRFVEPFTSSPYWLGQIGLAAISALAVTALGWLVGPHKGFGGLLLVGALITLLILASCVVAFDIAGKMLQAIETAELVVTPGPQDLAPEDGVGGAKGGRMTVAAREALNAQLDAQLERTQRWMPGARGLQQRLTARSIRRIYASMTALAAERGFVRLPTTTPYEYLPSAKRAFPGAKAQAALITEACVAVHYGEIPETSQALAEIRQAWSQLRQQAARQPACVVKEQAAKG